MILFTNITFTTKVIYNRMGYYLISNDNLRFCCGIWATATNKKKTKVTPTYFDDKITNT